MNEERKKVLIIGVIGADVHAVGNKILYHAFTEAGFDVVNLGVMVSQEEYIEAAIESDADAIVVSSPVRAGGAGLPRHAGKVRRGWSCRDSAARRRQYRRRQAGFADVEKRFKAMGFDRAFPPGTPPENDHRRAAGDSVCGVPWTRSEGTAQ